MEKEIMNMLLNKQQSNTLYIPMEEEARPHLLQHSTTEYLQGHNTRREANKLRCFHWRFIAL